MHPIGLSILLHGFLKHARLYRNPRVTDYVSLTICPRELHFMGIRPLTPSLLPLDLDSFFGSKPSHLLNLILRDIRRYMLPGTGRLSYGWIIHSQVEGIL